jgi:SET domain-containing protein
MYTVKTYLDRSVIEGTGVFAGEDIARDTVVWTLVDGFDQVLSPDHVKTLPIQAQEYIARYAYLMNGMIHLNADHGKFTNHDDNANTFTLPDGDVVACRAIKKGEEITCNYREFDDLSQEKLDFK